MHATLSGAAKATFGNAAGAAGTFEHLMTISPFAEVRSEVPSGTDDETTDDDA